MILHTIFEVLMVLVILTLSVLCCGKQIGMAIRFFNCKKYDSYGISLTMAILYLTIICKVIFSL